MNRNLLCFLLLSGLVLGPLPSPARASDQPQWGQAWSRNMVSPEQGLPESFDPQSGRNIQWSAELGTETHSSPVVAGGRVYIGTNNGHPRDPAQHGDRGVLMCFEEKTGRFLWQLLFPKRDEDIYFDWPKSGISSPVTVEGDRVYFVNNRGVVLCIEPPPSGAGVPPVAPGVSPGPKTVWQFDLTSGAGIWSHDAAHSSILIQGDYLYLNSGTGVDNTHKRIRTPDAPSLVVLDKRTGRYVARDNEHIAPNIFHSTWSAPSMANVNGRPLIFFAGGNGVVYAFNLVQNGEKEPASSGAAASDASSQVLALQHRFPPSSSARSGNSTSTPPRPRATCISTISNRHESPSDIFGMPVFDNNRIYVAGGGDIWWGKNEAWLKCIDATRTGDITTNGLVWSYTLQKHVMATPAVYRRPRVHRGCRAHVPLRGCANRPTVLDA